jgi:putative intracellular protease/amidase
MAPRGRGPYRALFVLPTTGLYSPDYLRTVESLQAADFKVRLTALTDQPSTLKNDPAREGPRRDEPYGDNLRAADYDVIIFTGFDTAEFEPGGIAEATTRRLIGEFQQEGKLLAAICRGQRVLAAHGELQGKAAAYCKYVDHPQYAEANTTNAGVEVADRIVTAAADANAPEFVARIAEILSAP